MYTLTTLNGNKNNFFNYKLNYKSETEFIYKWYK